MLRLNQIFLIHFVIIFSVTLALTAIVSYLTIRHLEMKQHKEHLMNSIELVTMQLRHGEDLEKLVINIRNRTNFRATIINQRGNILAESHHSRLNMDNHSRREEIIEAQKNGIGISVRYSKTTKEDRLYVAKKILFDDKIIYLRLSSSIRIILEKFYRLWLNITPLFAIFIFIGMAINYRVSRRIANDLGVLESHLEQIAQKNYKIIPTKTFSKEFSVLTKYLEKLALKLHKRDRQKQKYTAKLRLMNKQRNMLVSSLSHEFKNPIASMIGYAQTLHNDPGCQGKTRERFLQKIVNNGQKINTMLDRISLSISLDNDDFKPSNDSFDLDDVVKDAVQDMEKKYRDRNIVYNGVSRQVHADKTLLELAVINLIDNALKYSQEDIEVRLDQDSFSVRDNGIGIAEAEVDKITKKFYRVDKNLWDNSMGLGLSIVSFILKAHSLSLKIESKENSGSTFSFDIDEIMNQKAKQ